MSIFLVLFLLGLVQGLTEFLPVSSSGHLVLLSNLLGVEESLFISILLHVATLLSIFVVFYKDIIYLIKHPLSQQSMMLVFATIPTCIIVLILLPIIKSSFSGNLLPYCFLISAILLLLTELLVKKNKQKKYSNYIIALVMGIAQGFAVFPGISRSGSTICAGLLAGEKEAPKFSFLMSIPIILLSMIMEIYEICIESVVINFNLWAVLISFVVAFLMGVLAIKFMLKLTKKTNFKWFSLYLFIISIITFFII